MLGSFAVVLLLISKIFRHTERLRRLVHATVWSLVSERCSCLSYICENCNVFALFLKFFSSAILLFCQSWKHMEWQCLLTQPCHFKYLFLTVDMRSSIGPLSCLIRAFTPCRLSGYAWWGYLISNDWIHHCSSVVNTQNFQAHGMIEKASVCNNKIFDFRLIFFFPDNSKTIQTMAAVANLSILEPLFVLLLKLF